MNCWLLNLSFGTILVGCASTPDLPRDYALDASNTEGLVIASMTLLGKSINQLNGLEFNIRQLSPRDEEMLTKTPHFAGATQHARWVAAGGDVGQTKATWAATVNGINSAESLDIVEGDRLSGRLMVLRLSAGDYEVYSWKAVERTTYGEMEYRPKKAFSHRFTVKSGEATYLGRLRLQLGDNDLQKLVIEDRRSADLILFRNKYPKLEITELN